MKLKEQIKTYCKHSSMKWVAQYREERISFFNQHTICCVFFSQRLQHVPLINAVSEKGLERIRYNAGGTAALQQPRDPQTSNPSISLNQPGKAEPSTDPIARKFTQALIPVLSEKRLKRHDLDSNYGGTWSISLRPTHIIHTYLHLCIWQYIDSITEHAKKKRRKCETTAFSDF